MDVTQKEYETPDSTTSSSADDDVAKSRLSGCSWFKHGMDHGSLFAHCLAMNREFHREPKNIGSKSRSLKERVEDANFHAEAMRASGINTRGSLLVLRREREMWGALATLFLENRMSYLNAKSFGEDLPAEDEVDGRRRWPPADLSTDWFHFDESYDLLQSSRDALIHECTINNIRLPGNSEGKEEELVFRIARGDLVLEHAKRMRCLTLSDVGVKNYWRGVASKHLDDLLQFHFEMSFVNERTAKCSSG
jgi:hypothetical protein